MVKAETPSGQISEILAEISVGAMLLVFYESDGVTPELFQATDQMVLGITEGSPDLAMVTAYEFDGAMSGKIQLQHPSTAFWVQGVSSQGLTNPIVLGPSTEETVFTLTDMGGGQLTIQMETSPPLPFVLPKPSRSQPGWWLCSGSADPGVGGYTIEIAG